MRLGIIAGLLLLLLCGSASAAEDVDDEAVRRQAGAIAEEMATRESRAAEAPAATGDGLPASGERKPAGPWERRNRYLAVAIDNLRRNYTEFDRQGRTFDGIVDEENGNLHGLAAALRWEEVAEDRFGGRPFLVDGDLRVDTGNTAYRGYLQNISSGTLTPYNGNTANVIADMRARVMLGLCGGERVRVLPWAEWRLDWWYRDLGQYDEMYEHQALLAGAMLQWAASGDVVVELDGGVGVIVFSHIEVPSIGLSETLGNEPVDTLALTLRWQFGERDGLFASLRRDNSAYAGSAVSNGFFEPPSETRQTSVQLGMAHAF